MTGIITSSGEGYATNLRIDENGAHHFHHEQECGGILEENKEAQNSGIGQGSADMKHAARIPIALLEQWKNEENLDYNLVGSCPETTGRFWKKLQSREWMHLRRWKGRVV